MRGGQHRLGAFAGRPRTGDRVGRRDDRGQQLLAGGREHGGDASVTPDLEGGRGDGVAEPRDERLSREVAHAAQAELVAHGHLLGRRQDQGGVQVERTEQAQVGVFLHAHHGDVAETLIEQGGGIRLPVAECEEVAAGFDDGRRVSGGGGLDGTADDAGRGRAHDFGERIDRAGVQEDVDARLHGDGSLSRAGHLSDDQHLAGWTLLGADGGEAEGRLVTTRHIADSVAQFAHALSGLDCGGLVNDAMEPAVGLEPTTCCLRNSCSASELHRRSD